MIANRLALLAAAAVIVATPARADDTITIGFTVSQTGPLNNDSVSQMRGFELWRDQVNAAGWLKAGGKPYKIKFAPHHREYQNIGVPQPYHPPTDLVKAQFLCRPP